MRLSLRIAGEVREVEVPDPTEAEKERLLRAAIRQKLSDAAFAVRYAEHPEITRKKKWIAVDSQIFNWSIGGYYPKGDKNAD